MRDSGLNDTRTALLGVLIRTGAQLRVAVEDVDQLEPCGAVEVTGAPLKGTVIQGKEVPQLVDELPVLAVAGALASGTTIIRQAEELRVEETDRIAAIAHNLRAMGTQVVELKDGLEIQYPDVPHCAERASPVSATIASRWLLLLPVYMPMARRSFRMWSAFASLYPVSKKRSRNS